MAQVDAGAGAGLAAVVVFLTLLLLASWVVLLRVRQAMVRTTRQHQRELRTLTSRSNELEATLNSMVEGVFAVDPRRRVLGINRAAALLLGIPPDDATDQPTDQIIDSAPLRRFVDDALLADQPTQTDVDLPDTNSSAGPAGAPRVFRAQGAVLRNHEGRRIGTLIVLHDISRLRRLEVVRRDFVANASHEIKTPISAIKAAAETLLDIDGDDAEAARRFVGVIARQADRLQALVEDLLSLARIEHETERQHTPLELAPIADVLYAAAESCQSRAAEHRVRVVVECPPDLLAAMNVRLVEQAVVNLIDNAIKYGGDGKSVRVSAERIDPEAVIHVEDEGPGLPADQLERVFERFYRIDKTRSRRLGGTGLGLSIVGHIALAHGGHASADSAPDRGSTFRIHLPIS